VPVNHRPRHAGRSKYGMLGRLTAGIVDLAGVMWLIQRRCHSSVRELTESTPLPAPAQTSVWDSGMRRPG
jgi:hypothetical protein